MLSDKQLQEVLDAHELCQSSGIKAAKYLGIATSTFYERFIKAKERLHYKVPEGQTLKGVSTLRDAEGNKVLEWTKTDKDLDKQRDIVVQVAEALKEELPKIDPIKSPEYFNEDLMTVIPMGDPHIGLYCWAEEVGESFDLDIAKKDLCGAVEHLVNSGPSCKRCIIINLGDFFHADNMSGITSRSGHTLDMASRLPHMVKIGVSALRYCIEKAVEKHEIVEIINIPGNHDDVLGFVLSIMLANIYENDPRILVHDQPKTRFYIEHGKVLIGATHGHETKHKDLPGIMATEKPKAWGRTKFRYYYQGHFHHDKRIEMNGCMIEQFRTLAPSDSYSYSRGYLSGNDMKSILHHKEYGEVGRTICSIEMLRQLQTK